jgi:methyltransferase
MEGAVADGAWLLGFVTLDRVAEFAWAARNTHALRLRGGIEFGQSHYPLIVAFNVAWLSGLWWFGYGEPANAGLTVLFAGLFALRVWALASLRERFTTRIIVLPGAPPVRRGPYRRLRHPIYVLTALEVAIVPLALGLPRYAGLFSLLQIPLVMHRMAIEGAALVWAQGSAGVEGSSTPPAAG